MKPRWRSAVYAAILATITGGCGNSSGTDAVTASRQPKGDPVRGEQLYQQCAACHSLASNATGPKHCQLIGRQAGSLPDFDFSPAMRESGLIWDAQTLDEFLTSPISYVSGTRMGFAGFSDAEDRADVIAYLYQVNEDPATCPAG